ncbi:pyrimidine reductase family protein [Rhodococcus tibetensis]|uniref:Pyrimidine reductase family protein n=1 Tax=Rhodococcus tibetensis TaxID=2965064 RepID=A0ABT1QE72_9NOCA|nr:pyrimidine reductase family protein [Rhodococcus sp. FXJ9.536]MCQ4120574.1 pyrimidine reductase family protein [Rhodococcus sp. FXJ9.536]
MPTMRTVNTGSDEVSAEEFYRDPPDGVRVNMVASLDGAAAFDGRVRPLSDAVDHQLLRALRTYADVVLVGAGTIRAERYGPAMLTEEQSRYRLERWGLAAPPPIAVVTRTGNIPLDTPLFTGDVRPIVVTTQRTATERGAALEEVADVVVAGKDTVDLPALITAFGDRGFRRILCEGGPTLLDDLVTHDLVDEMCLTLAPKLAGPQPQRATAGPTLGAPRSLSLQHVLTHDDFLYLRYGRGR